MSTTLTCKLRCFNAEDLRAKLVQLLLNGEFFSVSIESSTERGNIEEMILVRLLENYQPVYKYAAVKSLSKPDAAGTAAAGVSALETMSTDGAPVNVHD